MRAVLPGLEKWKSGVIGKRKSFGIVNLDDMLWNKVSAVLPFMIKPGQCSNMSGIHNCMFPCLDRTKDLKPDGHPKSSAPSPILDRMYGRATLSVYRPFQVGMQIEKIGFVESVQHKVSKSVGDMIVVRHVDEFRCNGETDPCLVETRDIIYYDATTSKKNASTMATIHDDDDDIVVADASFSPVDLFRFSAITFNSHRIHYDQSFCLARGFPGLVVHGPLLGLLAMHHTLSDHGPFQFTYSFKGTLCISDKQQQAKATIYKSGKVVDGVDGRLLVHFEHARL